MAYNVSLKATIFGGEVNFLDSQQTRSVRGGVTLDASAVTADPVTGLKKLLAGTFIGESGGKYKKYEAAVKANKATGVVGNNNAILWTAVSGGAAGNGIKVALIDPAGNSKPLEVTVVNNEIRVQVATGDAGAITSTAADVIAAVNASLLAKGLVVAANSGTSDGTGVVAAVAATALAGGADANVTPTLILAEEVDFTGFTQSGGVAYADQVATGYDMARVIAARLPEQPDDFVKASMPGITFV